MEMSLRIDAQQMANLAERAWDAAREHTDLERKHRRRAEDEHDEYRQRLALVEADVEQECKTATQFETELQHATDGLDHLMEIVSRLQELVNAKAKELQDEQTNSRCLEATIARIRTDANSKYSTVSITTSMSSKPFATDV